MPRVGDTCETQNGRGHIVDRNLLTREVTVQLDETDNRFSCDCNEVRIVYPEKYKIPRNKK